jgi:hypothetical protein
MSSAEKSLETPEESSGYRFRLRDMMGFITLCALQFAIISWIGALYGVLVGLGIAMIIFSGTFLRQLWVGAREVIAYRDGKTAEPPKFRAREQRHLISLAMATYFMGAAAMLTGGGVVIANVASDWMIRREMSKKCGFEFLVMPTRLANGQRVDLIDIQAVTPDGPFDKSGIRKGDVIYAGSAGKFFRETLFANKGKPVTLDVRKWTKNTTIDKAPSKETMVNVPP